MFVDGGREKSRATPTNWAPSSRTVTKMCTVPSKRSQNLSLAKKIVWHVLDSHLSFVKDKNEWNDTDIVFDISEEQDKTEVRFTHLGLVPQYECYGSCSNAWGTLINGNLRKLITTGKGQPDAFA